MPDDPVDDLWQGHGTAMVLPEGQLAANLYVRGARAHPGTMGKYPQNWGKPHTTARSHLPLLSTGDPSMPDGSQAKPTLTIEKFRPVVKNTLRGFVDVHLPFGGAALVIKDISIHRKGDRAWCGLPAKPKITPDGAAMKGEDGRIAYVNVLEWSSREMSDRFSTKVIELVEAAHPGATL